MSLTLSDAGGMAVPLWAPAGVAVAAFHLCSLRSWPWLLAAMFAAQTGLWLTDGMSLSQASMLALAELAQSTLAAYLSFRVLGGRAIQPTKFRQVMGLFGAVIAATLVSVGLLAMTMPEPVFAQLSHLALANVIGILTVTPIYIRMRHRLLSRSHNIDSSAVRELVLLLPLIAILSFAVLAYKPLVFAPLLVTTIVMITFRFGDGSSSLAVMVFAAVSMVVTLRYGSPLPTTSLPKETASLLFQCWMMILLATRLPLVAMLFKREELRLELVERNAQMHESLLLFDLAEETAGIGRWQLDLLTGEQDWSPKMMELTGVPIELGSDPGDVSDFMPDRGEEFFRQIMDNRDNRDTYTFTYRVKPPDATERILRISILNEFDMTGKRISVFGVALDVTEQVRREEALDLARARAVRLAAEAQKLANTDPLTSLPNRRCTFGRLESMIEAASTSDGSLTAIMFDVDHFKRVNDVYGHQTGDEVLVQMAELARRQARAGDVVGRIGGEEFVWLISAMDEDAARKLAERLRHSVESGMEGSNLPDVTVSIGVAHFRPGDDETSLLARADAALYEAKEGGRNQVKRAA